MVYSTLVFWHRDKGTNRRKTVYVLYRTCIQVSRGITLIPDSSPTRAVSLVARFWALFIGVPCHLPLRPWRQPSSTCTSGVCLLDQTLLPSRQMPCPNSVFFSQELLEECQTIVRTRCGKNGLPLALNRKPGSAPAPKKTIATKHEELLTALAALGIQTTPAKVAAILEILPKDLPEGELIKAVFRELKKTA